MTKVTFVSVSPDTDQVELKSTDLVGLLTGSWNFVRRIEDRRSGTRGQAIGTAEFIPDDGGLKWIETGELELGSFIGPVSRELRIEKDGGSWQVLFDDGRLFHPIDLSQGHCSAEHPCRADLYSGSLRIHNSPPGPELTTDWNVTGPEKDHRIITAYRRA